MKITFLNHDKALPLRRFSIITLVWIAFFLPLFSSCSDNQVLRSPEKEPAGVRIELEKKSIAEGDSIGVRFVVLDHYDQPFEEIPPWMTASWNVENDQVFTIDKETLKALSIGESDLLVNVGDFQSKETIRVNPREIRTDIQQAYVLQSVQSNANSVPLVSDKEGFLRVYVRADRLNFFDPPDIRALVYSGNSLVEKITVEPHASMKTATKIPEVVDETGSEMSWGIPLPAHLVKPGMRVKLEFDPERRLPLTADSRVWYPSEHETLELDVHDPAPFDITFVPVHQNGVGTGDITLDNADEFIEHTRRFFPLNEINVNVREPYTTSLKADSEKNWSKILSELRALRVADGSSRYYHGIVKRIGGPGGIGYVNHPVALSYDGLPRAGRTVAHEIGHNFGLLHVDCGNPDLVDHDYPHEGGVIGSYGYDIANDKVYPPSTPDFMSYCGPGWISDYHVEKVRNFRKQEQKKTAAGKTANRKSLLVWGRIGREEVSIEPSFYIHARPVLPDGDGDYQIEIIDDTDAVVYSAAFTPEQIADGPGGEKHFTFSIPVDQFGDTSVRKIRIEGPGRSGERIAQISREQKQQLKTGNAQVIHVRAQKQQDGATIVWDQKNYPMVMVTDPGSGRILSFARDGKGSVHREIDTIDLHISDGTTSVKQTLKINGR